MASIKLFNKDGDKKAVELQNGIEKKFGFVPEVFQAMGRNGDFLQEALHLGEVAGKGLDPKTKELIAVAVSAITSMRASRAHIPFQTAFFVISSIVSSPFPRY